MIDLIYFCQYFYGSHHIPLILFQEGEPKFCLGLPETATSKVENITDYSKFSRPEVVFEASQQAFYGAIPLENQQLLILGPIYSFAIDDKFVRYFQRLNSLTLSLEETKQFLMDIPKYSYNQFLQLIIFLAYAITHQKQSLSLQRETSYHHLSEMIAAKHTDAIYTSRLEQSYHDIYDFEQLLIKYVASGEITALKELLEHYSQLNYMSEGELSSDPIRQAKNIFIGNITLIAKQAAIPAGLAVEETYQLVETYIQECERLQNMEAIITLQYNMLIDFTERVAQNRLPQAISPDILKCVRYIDLHYTEMITVDNLVRHSNRSKSSLSSLFKAEMGMTITEYITQQRISHAKTLLHFSDKSLSEISEFLNFSSQSYFQNVFKKQVGVTPLEYRKQKNSSTN